MNSRSCGNRLSAWASVTSQPARWSEVPIMRRNTGQGDTASQLSHRNFIFRRKSSCSSSNSLQNFKKIITNEKKLRHISGRHALGLLSHAQHGREYGLFWGKGRAQIMIRKIFMRLNLRTPRASLFASIAPIMILSAVSIVHAGAMHVSGIGTPANAFLVSRYKSFNAAYAAAVAMPNSVIIGDMNSNLVSGKRLRLPCPISGRAGRSRKPPEAGYLLFSVDLKRAIGSRCSV